MSITPQDRYGDAMQAAADRTATPPESTSGGVLDEPTTIGRAMEYHQLGSEAIRERIAEEQAERNFRLYAAGLLLSDSKRAQCASTARMLRTRRDADLSAIADQLDLVAGRSSVTTGATS